METVTNIRAIFWSLADGPLKKTTSQVSVNQNFITHEKETGLSWV